MGMKATWPIVGVVITAAIAVNCGKGGGGNPLSPGAVEPTQASLQAPYQNRSDVSAIRAGFSATANAPWGVEHWGLTLYTVGDGRRFVAAAAGTVGSLRLWQNGAFWQVNFDLNLADGSQLTYGFFTGSGDRADGDAQLAAMVVVNAQRVAAGDPVGSLRTPNADARLEFTVMVNNKGVCPERYLATDVKDAMVGLLRLAYPGANMCY